MRTRAKRKYAAGGRARREHVPEHMLFYDTGNFVFKIRIKKDTVMRVCQFFVISY